MKHPADAARLARRHRSPDALQQLDEAAEWLAQLDEVVTDAALWCRELLHLPSAYDSGAETCG